MFSVKVRVQYFAAVRELVGLREETLELADGSTVSVLIDGLVKRHGRRFSEFLYAAGTGNLRPSIQLLIGDMSVSSTKGLSTVLSDGVVFAIIPPVGGG